MSNPFPDRQAENPDCPALPEIDTISIDSFDGEIPEPPPFWDEGDPFIIVIPDPDTPLGCFKPSFNVLVTQNVDEPVGGYADVHPAEDDGDLCNLEIDFHLNIPLIDTSYIDTFCPIFSAGDFNVTHPVDQVGTEGAITAQRTSEMCEFILNFDMAQPCQVAPAGIIADPSLDGAPHTERANTDLYGYVSTSGLATNTFFYVIFVQSDGGNCDRLEEADMPHPAELVGCVVQFTRDSGGVSTGDTRRIVSAMRLAGGMWLSFSAVTTTDPYLAPWPGVPCRHAKCADGSCGTGADFIILCGNDHIGSGAQAVNECDQAKSLELPMPLKGIVKQRRPSEGPSRWYHVKLVGDDDHEDDPTKYRLMKNVAVSTYNLGYDRNEIPVGTPVLVYYDSEATRNPDDPPEEEFTKYFFNLYEEPMDEICGEENPLQISFGDLRLPLWSYPAGILQHIANPSPYAVHVIACPDPDGVGWLPAELAPVDVDQIPEGAKFWYNLPMDPSGLGEQIYRRLGEQLVAQFPHNIYLEVDGTVPAHSYQPPNPADGAVLLSNADPIVVITPLGIWWMKDTYGNVPWPDVLATDGDAYIAAGDYCPAAVEASGYNRAYYGYSDQNTDRLVILNIRN